jgi:uncharacterized protein YndB with AHSA1/START domain
MHVKKDASGQRSVSAEVELPGTPEEIWNAIATGPGVSSWFVPAKVEEELGGAITMNFGPGMDSESKITTWDPPRRFVAENEGGMGPGSPAMATEWTVEARSGGTCLVRVVHRWFAETDDWDGQFEGTVHGWNAFFRILRLYLAHFRGKPCSAIQLMGFAPGPMANAWASWTRTLGFEHPAAGQRVSTSGDAPRAAGTVELADEGAQPELLLRLEEPAPGVAHLMGISMGGLMCLSMRFFFYGDRAAAAVARDESAWQAWMNEHFPAPQRSGATS